MRTILDAGCPAGRSHCDASHVTYIPQAGPYPSQEWVLVRLSFPFPGPLPSLGLAPPSKSKPVLPDTLPRRTFRLQNVESGLYATIIRNHLEGQNVVLQSDPYPETEWTFIHTMQSHPRIDMLAIASTVVPVTIDHFGGGYVNASKCWSNNSFHSWIPIPRDGVFVFKNYATNRILCGTPQLVVDTMPEGLIRKPACHWRLVDPQTEKACSVLYDSALSIVPPELAGPALRPPPPSTPSEPGLTLQITAATGEIDRNFNNGLRADHEMIRFLLKSGSSAVVLAPRVITGWLMGRVATVLLSGAEEEEDGGGQYAAKKNRSMDECPPRY
jgi:hypothetical protein